MSIIIYKKTGPVISLINVEYVHWNEDGQILLQVANDETTVFRYKFKSSDIKQIKIMEE